MRKGRFGAAVFGASVAGALSLAGSSVQAGELNEPLFLFPLAVPVDPLTPEATEPTISPTADYTEPVVVPPAPSGWTWAITPRVWLFWENDFFFQHEAEDFQQSNEAVFIPFAGGSISVTPGAGRPTFSLTVLYGKGSSDVRGQSGLLFEYEGDVDTKRLDVEGIAQIPVAEGFNWIIGGRFINFKRDENGIFHDQCQDIFSFFCFITGIEPLPDLPVKQSIEQNFYLAEAGFGVNRPVTADGKVVAFGNLIGMLGYADVVDLSLTGIDVRGSEVAFFNKPKGALEGGVFGVDTNAGFGYLIAPNILASARYRLFYLTAPDFKFKDGGHFIHGPEFNVTFTFGG